jgi:hypothetical protein
MNLRNMFSSSLVAMRGEHVLLGSRRQAIHFRFTDGVREIATCKILLTLEREE